MQKKKPEKIKTGKLVMAGTAGIVLLTAALYLVYHYELANILKEYLSQRMPPGIFLFLMLVLPLVGVPISIFLVLVGIKFGIVEGALLSAVIMCCHMAITYYLVHSFMRKWLTSLLAHYNLPVPKLRGDKKRRHAFIFMLIPGLPYTVKNYVLALAEIGFAPYMTINWTAQFGLSLPFIILGSAVMEMNLKILMMAIALLSAGYLLQYYLRKKYGNSS